MEDNEMANAGAIRIGIAGWNFAEWRGEFYPKGLPQKQELNFASRALRTIEINGTFYGHQKPESFASWANETPESFRFTVKGHQLVTHLKKLKDVEIPLANFFASGPLALGKKLGPFVWQLPPNLGFDAERMEKFLGQLPKTTDDLVALAGKHDERLKSSPFTSAKDVGPIRHAIEVRHKSFADPAFIAQMRHHNVALVTADTLDWPAVDVTADFAYLRLQGAPGKERYEDAELDVWAARLEALAMGAAMPDAKYIDGPPESTPRDVFAYFVSTDKVHAPRNAMYVMERLGLSGPD
jgi:uncharacterized protein YecE (DUF72 family)